MAACYHRPRDGANALGGPDKAEGPVGIGRGPGARPPEFAWVNFT